MLVRSVEIENIRTFRNSINAQFEPGFNVLVGANNAGKTTMLEAICMTSSEDLHRSIVSIPRKGERPPRAWHATTTTELHLGELRRWNGGGVLALPIADFGVHDQQQAKAFSTFVDNDPLITFQKTINEVGEGIQVTSSGQIYGGYAPGNQNSPILSATLNFESGSLQPPEFFQQNLGGALNHYSEILKKRLYCFNASRRPLQDSQATNPVLDSAAGNLAYCLNFLQTSNSYLFAEFCRLVSRVLPTIKWVQSTPSGQLFSISCLPSDSNDQREDLGIGLSRMGAGVGNVLAILFVMLTSSEPQVIAIDEPNAFLHPRALRELLAILEADGAKHQYFLTAHSADVITAIRPSTVSLLKLERYSTTIEQKLGSDLHSIKGGLAEIGVRITDLHSKDGVLWVEGQTEELVIPDLLKVSCPQVAASIGVLRVEHTGDFSSKRKHRKRALNLYERLSQSTGLVPPLVMILLDGEARGSNGVQDKEYSRVIRFLDRRMLESYLLDYEAIAAALAERGLVYEKSRVKDLLDEKVALGGGWGQIRTLDAVAVLREVFAEIGNIPEAFDKTRDVPAMVSWLIVNKVESLDSLVREIRELIDQ